MERQATDDVASRQAAMRLCALATTEEVARLAERFAAKEAVRDLRPPAQGLVMLRGRIGGEGAPFNVGEATVVRAAVSLADGLTGFAYHLGRDGLKARGAAILDALRQREALRGEIDRALGIVADRLAREERREAERTAATRVEFFTMARGEDRP